MFFHVISLDMVDHCLQMMKKRHKIERDLSIGEEVGWSKNQQVAKSNPTLAAMNKKFGMIHGLSSLANIMSFGSLAMHSWCLASKLELWRAAKMTTFSALLCRILSGRWYWCMSYLMRSLDYIVRLRYWLQRRIILVKKEIRCVAWCSQTSYSKSEKFSHVGGICWCFLCGGVTNWDSSASVRPSLEPRIYRTQK